FPNLFTHDRRWLVLRKLPFFNRDLYNLRLAKLFYGDVLLDIGDTFVILVFDHGANTGRSPTCVPPRGLHSRFTEQLSDLSQTGSREHFIVHSTNPVGFLVLYFELFFSVSNPLIPKDAMTHHRQFATLYSRTATTYRSVYAP